MILWNEKVKKSEDIINAVINQLYKENLNIDGVVEIFNNGKEQGCLLKIYDKYNPNLDICIWLYLPSDRKMNNEINIIFGNHVNCNNLNMWNDNNLESFLISDVKAREMHKKARDLILEKIIKNIQKTNEFIKI